MTSIWCHELNSRVGAAYPVARSTPTELAAIATAIDQEIRASTKKPFVSALPVLRARLAAHQVAAESAMPVALRSEHDLANALNTLSRELYERWKYAVVFDGHRGRQHLNGEPFTSASCPKSVTIYKVVDINAALAEERGRTARG